MTGKYPVWVEEIRAKYGDKKFFTFQETMSILECGRDYVYDRLASGALLAHNPTGFPGRKGTRIIGASIWNLLKEGQVKTDNWN